MKTLRKRYEIRIITSKVSFMQQTLGCTKRDHKKIGLLKELEIRLHSPVPKSLASTCKTNVHIQNSSSSLDLSTKLINITGYIHEEKCGIFVNRIKSSYKTVI